MKRMIDDYIARFYDKEAARSKRLVADDFAKARDIAAWKQHVAARMGRHQGVRCETR